MVTWNSISNKLAKILKHRCSGACCKCFWLSESIEEIEKSYKRFTGELKDNGVVFNEIDIVYPMLIPVPPPKGACKDHYWYTCKHLKSDNNCGIYNTRPKMCSEYPYGAKCNYKNCTWGKVSANSILYKIGFGCKNKGLTHPNPIG
jgi:Fe-S-cluster containining protein